MITQYLLLNTLQAKPTLQIIFHPVPFTSDKKYMQYLLRLLIIKSASVTGKTIRILLQGTYIAVLLIITDKDR